MKRLGRRKITGRDQQRALDSSRRSAGPAVSRLAGSRGCEQRCRLAPPPPALRQASPSSLEGSDDPNPPDPPDGSSGDPVASNVANAPSPDPNRPGKISTLLIAASSSRFEGMAGTAQSVHNKEGGASEHSCHEREQKYERRDDGANFNTINKMVIECRSETVLQPVVADRKPAPSPVSSQYQVPA